MNKTVACSLSLVLATLLASEASARPLRIDFGSPFNADGTGASWPDSFNDNVNVEGNGVFNGSLAGAGFALSFGGADFSDFCLAEDGIVTLSTQSACGGTNDLVISVLANNWLSDATAAATSEGSVSYSEGGLIDLEAPFVESEAQRAIRFFWHDLLLSPAVGGDDIERFGFQALFLERAGGGFDLELNYGRDSGVQQFPGVQSITFGGSSLFDGTPPILTSSFAFSFVGDVFTVGTGGGTTNPPTSVPEPGTLSMLLAGFCVLAAGLRRRQARRAPIAA
jgi:PEP-CTERM motif